ncbi:MAG: SpoIVB peptidase [Clostridia bacterium]|nr:SpoIVB peptidase [Clostridia bacterium]MDQ7791965.1 SpoIVB peptidase [Clostridia bacterium]
MPRIEITRIRRLGAIFFAILLVFACSSPVSRSIYGLQPRQHVLVGDSLDLSLNIPPSLLKTLIIQADRPNALKVVRPGVAPIVQSTGEFNVSIKLFGIIPLRHVTVTAVPEIKVIPGGQSIGVMLNSSGVMVVGEAPVFEESGRESNPARRAGIMPGDLITQINGRSVSSEAQVRETIEELGRNHKEVVLTVKRNHRTFRTKLKPLYCQETGRYRIGIMIRDGAAGVGTLTFYEPESGCYGALGHMITDSQTMRPIELADGKIVLADIQGIRPGRRGQPGEKLGSFADDQMLSGNINNNSSCGIFGVLDEPLQNPLFGRPIPVALLNQTRVGPAKMLTVIDGQRVEAFDLIIEKIRPESVHDGKGLVICIVDQRLLEKSGGIIQGMSGSPIIQNGFLIGAVTHVFVNNPARGYGVPVEWMLRECGLLNTSIVHEQASNIGQSTPKQHYLCRIVV